VLPSPSGERLTTGLHQQRLLCQQRNCWLTNLLQNVFNDVELDFTGPVCQNIGYLYLNLVGIIWK